MAQLPVFKPSSNLSKDIRQLEESKAMSYGFWKGQLIEKGEAVSGTTKINGHSCMSKFAIDYVSDTDKAFLELLGMGEDEFADINETQSNSRVRHVDFEWKPSFEGTQESLQLYYDLIKGYCPTVATIEIYGETHYETTGNPALQFIKSPSTKSREDLAYKDWYEEPPTMKLYDSGMLEIHTGDTDTNWYKALLNLMVMDGNRIMSYASTTTESERSYDKGTALNPELWYAVLGKDTYSGLFADNVHEGFGDLLIKESTKTTTYDLGVTFSNTYGGDFWSSAEQELDSSSSTFSPLTGLVAKYFEIYDGKYYLKYDAVQSAPADELQYIVGNFAKITIVEDKKWYDGFVKLLGSIFQIIAKIGQGLFDFLMKIPVIGQWIELHLRFFGLITGKTYEEVKEFTRDNLGMAIVAVLTYGLSTTISLTAQSLILSIEAISLIAVETLSTISVLLAEALYIFIESLVYLLSMGAGLLGDAFDSMLSEFYNLGLAMENLTPEVIEEVEKLIKETEAISSIEETESKMDYMYEGMFNQLDVQLQQQENLVNIDLKYIN